MAIVTFWNNDREQSGKTLTAVAVATKMAIERNYKILLISTSFQDPTMKNCFWGNEVQRNLKLFGGKVFPVCSLSSFQNVTIDISNSF